MVNKLGKGLCLMFLLLWLCGCDKDSQTIRPEYRDDYEQQY